MTTIDKQSQSMRAVTIRFAGDSGDGMQLAGMRFTDSSAMFGNDVATLPDFPAEIRAPAGTVAGVSGFQIQFAAETIHTPGDSVSTLIAMNPAAFKANVSFVEPGGYVIVDEDEFTKINFKKAGYEPDYNPAKDEKFTSRYKICEVPITRLTKDALAETGMGAKDIARCRNMYALGVVCWLYDRPLEPTIDYLNDYFGKKKNRPEIAEANIKVLKAGYHYGDMTELFPVRYEVGKAPIKQGKYRRIMGNEAIAMGFVTASKLANKEIFYAGYPITPASDILHNLAALKKFGVKTYQAEDEIAAACVAIGASYAGHIGVCGSSGPGVALKGEALGLAVMTELPMILVDVQRGGPSTGLPTKTEQSDLFMTVYGRNGDCPMIVIAAKSPGDCFYAAIEAVRLTTKHMTPVILLSDGYIANGAEPWPIPDPDSLEPIEINEAVAPEGDEEFLPYQRNELLARPWVIPGAAGMEHRVGGIEKESGTGNVSYDPANHQRMTEIRRNKVKAVADTLPPTEIEGDPDAELLLIGWGGTYGAITTARERLAEEGIKVAQVHVRYISPLPKDLGDIMRRYDKIIVPEWNDGQLRMMLRAEYLVDSRGFNKVEGQPFKVHELVTAVKHMLSGQWGDATALTALDLREIYGD